MADNEKSSSPAATAKGTAPSTSKYYSSFPPIFQVSDPQAKDEMKRGRAYDKGNQGEAYNPDYLYGGENYHKALSDAVSYVLRSCAGDGLSYLSDVVVKVTNALVAWVNLSEPPSNPKADTLYGRGFRWPKLKSIDPVQAAELVFAQEVIRMVCVKETVDKPTSEGVLAMYDPDEGIYREIGDGQIDLWCQEVVGAANGNWKKNFAQKLHDMASRRENRVCECDNPFLVFMANGIWDYGERVLREFSPEVVALRKSATRLPDKEPPVPEHTMPDGSKIDFWQLLDSYVPYDGGRDLLVKVAGGVPAQLPQLARHGDLLQQDGSQREEHFPRLPQVARRLRRVHDLKPRAACRRHGWRAVRRVEHRGGLPHHVRGLRFGCVPEGQLAPEVNHLA